MQTTTSRNQREGGYLGRYKCVYDGLIARRRHHRKGGKHWPTLREYASRPF
jgi:hypothetical protein